MPLSPSFSVAQSATTPNQITVTDTSTGSDGAITQRRVYVQTTQGTYLVESGTTTDYEAWAYPTPTSITLDILTSDAAVNIRVDWLNSGNSVLYTSNANYCLSEYGKQFLYYLVQLQAATPQSLQDTNYFSNLAKFWMLITGANKAVEVGDDIASSQSLLDQATLMQDNQSTYF